MKDSNIDGLTESDIEQMIADRRDIHRHPELAYTEIRTARLAADRLAGFGLEVKTGVGRTGVVGLLKQDGAVGKSSAKTLLYRADMDALPILEETEKDYRSTNDGIMHACGHDAHVAIELAVAKRIRRLRDRINGNVKFVFQPAEEGGRGAVAMIEDGVLAEPDVTAVVGLHIWNNIPVGNVGIYAGPMMAAADEFEVVINGRGGHGAMPHQTTDAIVAASHVVTALQTIVSRNVSPLDAAVVTVGKFTAGSAFNVVAERATLRGTARTFSKDMYQAIPGMIERVIKGVTESMGATYELTYQRQTPLLVNDPGICELVAECAAEVVGSANVITDQSVPTMGAEDMAFFLESAPGCYFFLGSQNEEQGFVHPHHSPRFDIDEAALPIGVEIMTRVIMRYLA
jgi:amidohydrolase